MCQRICRLCFKSVDTDDPDVRSILDATVQIALKSVFPFEIEFREDLPMHTCKQCSWNVLDFHSYSEIVQKNQIKIASQYLPDKIPADTTYPIENEYFGLNNNPNASSPSLKEDRFNVDDMTMVKCKVEVDDILVANEIHPDFMDFYFDRNASITFGKYEISPAYDESTECSNNFNILNNLNDKMADGRNKTTGYDNATNQKKGKKARRVSNRKKKSLKKSLSTSTSGKNKRSQTLTTNTEYSCNKCEKKFKTKTELAKHKASDCTKKIRHRSMPRHLVTHKENYHRCGNQR